MTSQDPNTHPRKQICAEEYSFSGIETSSRIAPRDKRVALFGMSFFLDLLAIYSGYLCAIQIRDKQWLEAGGQSLLALSVPIFIAFAIGNKTQASETLDSTYLGVKRALAAWGATAISIILMTFLLQFEDISRLGFAVFFAVSATLMVIFKWLGSIVRQRTIGDHSFATVLILDGQFAEPDDGDDVIDVAKLGIWPDPTRPDFLDELARLLENYDRIIIASSDEHRMAWSIFLRGLDIGGEILLDRSTLLGAVGISEYGNQDTIVLSLGPLDLWGRIQKRIFDLFVSLAAVIILSPLFFVTALAIRLDSKGGAIFRQWRVGQSNRQFRMFKFRSMRLDSSDSRGKLSTQRNDERVTRVGRIIRRTSIDELPQLFNVIRGEMSLVGPRPHALGSTAGDRLFWEASKNYWLRHSLKPGMTGLAQIRGHRGATEKLEDLEQRVRCDLEYLSNWSLWLDCKILMQTVTVVLHDRAY